MRTLIQYKSDANMKGVLYIHDDALINITNIPLLGSNNTIIVTDHDAENPQIGLDNWRRWQKVSKETFKIYSNGTFSKVDDVRALKKSLRRWQRFPDYIKAHTSASNDPRSQPYQEKEDGTYLSPNLIQAHFMYVPASLAGEFASAAEILIDHIRYSLNVVFLKLLI
jgi:hypothetical protein